MEELMMVESCESKLMKDDQSESKIVLFIERDPQCSHFCSRGGGGRYDDRDRGGRGGRYGGRRGC